MAFELAEIALEKSLCSRQSPSIAYKLCGLAARYFVHSFNGKNIESVVRVDPCIRH